MKKNYVITWHDRHTDDQYFIVNNATLKELDEALLEVAKMAGWENETDCGYGEYGLGEGYYITYSEPKKIFN